MNGPDPIPEEDQIIEAATRWFHLRDSGAAFDAAGLETWLAAHLRHRQAFEDIVERDNRLQALKEAPELLAMRSEALKYARQSALAAHAGERRLNRRNLIAACIGGGVVTIGSVFGGMKLSAKTFKTDIGEQQSVKLADDSTIVLDANSEVRVHYKSKERHIQLVAGRAHFEVAKDANRPFVVQAHDKTVTALGTAFTVDLQGQKVAVTLIEGRISIQKSIAGGGQVRISDTVQPNQELVMADSGKIELIKDVDVSRSQAWREGAIYFDNETLEEAVERMNNYSRIQIRVEPGRIRNLPISGQFSAGNTASFVDAITSFYPVEVKKDGQTLLIKEKA